MRRSPRRCAGSKSIWTGCRRIYARFRSGSPGALWRIRSVPPWPTTAERRNHRKSAAPRPLGRLAKALPFRRRAPRFDRQRMTVLALRVVLRPAANRPESGASGLPVDAANPPILTRMYGPAVRRKRICRSGRYTVLHQCIRPLIGALSSGHHGYQRACVLISGQASTGPFGSPGFACAGKTDPYLINLRHATRFADLGMQVVSCEQPVVDEQQPAS